MDREELIGVVEAVLFSSDRPVSVSELIEVLGGGTGKDEIEDSVKALEQKYRETGRSFEVAHVAGGYQLVTVPAFAPWIRKFLKIRKAERLSRAALETLSIIAYRQPATRLEVEAIRGVNVDGVLHGLLERRLVRVMGRKKVVGRPLLYGTTNDFLEYFGLSSLSELPRYEELVERLAQRGELEEEGEGEAAAAEAGRESLEGFQAKTPPSVSAPEEEPSEPGSQISVSALEDKEAETEPETGPQTSVSVPEEEPSEPGSQTSVSASAETGTESLAESPEKAPSPRRVHK